MRKLVVVVLAALFAVGGASMAEAAKKGKRAKAKPVAAAPVNPNEASGRLVMSGLSQVFVPFQSMAQPAAPPPPAKGKKKK